MSAKAAAAAMCIRAERTSMGSGACLLESRPLPQTAPGRQPPSVVVAVDPQVSWAYETVEKR